MTRAHAVYLRQQGHAEGLEVTSAGVRRDWYPAVFAPAVARAMDGGGPEWAPVAGQVRAQLGRLVLVETSGGDVS